MTAKITAVVDSAASSVLVTVTGASGPTAEILRVESSGAKTPVRNGDPGTLLGGGWIDHDYEAPLDQPVTYQLAAPSNFNSVQATSMPVTVASLDQTWLKHPGRPDLNMPIKVTGWPQRTYGIAQGVFNVVGRKYPVVKSSLRYAPIGDMTVLTETADELDGMRALLSEPSILLLQAPAGYDVGSVYVAVGEVGEERISPAGADPVRNWTLPLTVVEAPVGLANAGAGNTWNDVIATYPTWNDVIAARATWNDLIRSVAG